MLTTVLGEPHTKGSAGENPLGQPVLKPGLTDVRLRLTDALPGAPPPETFGSRMEMEDAATLILNTHVGNMSVSWENPPSLPKE